MFEVLRYVNEAGVDVLGRWLSNLRDERAKAKINVRINRLAAENFGDCKPVGRGVMELRIDYGPGYRVYFAKVGPAMILLLCGGDKRRQQKDIEQAIDSVESYQRRTS